MKYFSRIISVGNASLRYLHLHIGRNQFRLTNMFSTRGHLLGTGLQVTKNLNKPLISKTTITRKLACSYFSVQVNVEGEVIPPIQGDKSLERKHLMEKAGTITNSSINKPKAIHLKRSSEEKISVILLQKLKALIKSSERDPYVLRNISTMLVNNDLELNVKQIVDLLYCLSVLNVHDEALLLKVLNITKEMLKDIYKPSPLILCISKSVGNLQMRHTEVLNGLIDWFNSRNHNEDYPEVTNLIQTLAILNYFPANADMLLMQVMKQNLSEFLSTTNYLNFVWSLALIDRINPEIAESVLIPSFRKKLESILVPELRSGAYFKLANIHAYANARKFKIRMDSSWYTTGNTLLNSMKEKRMRNSVIRNFIDCLANVMPIRTFSTFVEIESGCILDSVCFFDNDHKPVMELEFMKKKNGIKLAILFLMYKDLCSPSKTIPNGIVEFHKRFLESCNYKVLYLPFNEFQNQDNLRKKTDYIRQKIRSVLPKYDAEE